MSTSMIDRFETLQERVGSLANGLRSPLLLVLRVTWGWQFFQAGWGKLGNLGDVTNYFESLGIPAPGLNAAAAAATECFGGLLLLVGLGSRLVAIPLAFTMVVAYATAHRDAAAAVFSDLGGFTSQAPFLFLLTSLIVLAFGPGAVSVDVFLARRGKSAGAARPALL